VVRPGPTRQRHDHLPAASRRGGVRSGRSKVGASGDHRNPLRIARVCWAKVFCWQTSCRNNQVLQKSLLFAETLRRVFHLPHQKKAQATAPSSKGMKSLYDQGLKWCKFVRWRARHKHWCQTESLLPSSTGPACKTPDTESPSLIESRPRLPIAEPAIVSPPRRN